MARFRRGDIVDYLFSGSLGVVVEVEDDGIMAILVPIPGLRIYWAYPEEVMFVRRSRNTGFLDLYALLMSADDKRQDLESTAYIKRNLVVDRMLDETDTVDLSMSDKWHLKQILDELAPSKYEILTPLEIMELSSLEGQKKLLGRRIEEKLSEDLKGETGGN